MTGSQLRYDGRVAVVTGAGGGLGREYALYFAKRGASVVVNDYGVSLLGETGSSAAADAVVREVIQLGGKAVANYDSVAEGEKIIETAMKAFGRVDILINNAGILRDKTFAKMTDKEWEIIADVHLHGAFRTTKAAWAIFRKQKYGRVIMTTSPAGVYGNFGQANYSAAKHALIGFSDTLAAEGAKYNIKCNTISPLAASRLTETSMTKELLEHLNPKAVVPVVGYLVHEQTQASGGLYEVAGGYVSCVRWEVSRGAVFKPDPAFTPASVKARYNEVTSFTNNPLHPNIQNGVDYLGLMKQAQQSPANPVLPDLRYDGKVAVITGSGAGIGRIYALAFAKFGAKVVVNDVGRVNGVMSADSVVREITQNGGQAVANYDSVENGENVIKTAIDAYGRIDILINNAGILRDKSFANMSLKEWYDVYNIHLRGTYKVTKAAWPYFIKQKTGSIINTSSLVGLYGNFGQANYSSAKAAMIGFTKTLAFEGAKHGIRVNCIAPNAGTAMTATVFPPDIVELLKPDFIFPLVGFLSHDACKDSGKVFQVGSCWAGEARRQSTEGHLFKFDETFTPEAVRDNWTQITSFEIGQPRYSKTSAEFTMYVVKKLMSQNPDMRVGETNKRKAELAKSANKKTVNVEAARNHKFESKKFTFTERDVMLYALGIGASREDLDLVYELSPKFRTFPTFAVIPNFFVGANFTEFLPSFNPMMLLHGEEFVEIHNPIPTSGTLTCTSQILDIADKGKGAAVVSRMSIRDQNQKLIADVESTAFIRGMGGFSKQPGFKQLPPVPRSPFATLNIATPKDELPHAVYKQTISPSQAALYRLSGDYNPLHIDPQMAAMGNFTQPILHGLCSMGHAVRHVVKCMAAGNSDSLSSVKVRFSAPVYPGETLETRMWVSKQDPTVVLFDAKVVDRDLVVISNAIAKFKTNANPSSGVKNKL